jgi:hypothetical protein
MSKITFAPIYRFYANDQDMCDANPFGTPHHNLFPFLFGDLSALADTELVYFFYYTELLLRLSSSIPQHIVLVVDNLLTKMSSLSL